MSENKKINTPHKIPRRVPLPSEKIPIVAFILFGLALIGLAMVAIGRANLTFSDFFNQRISGPVRALLAHLTSWIPFSLAEFLIFLIPLFLVLLVLYAIRKKSATWRAVLSYTVTLLAGVSVIFTLFVLTYGLGYYVPTLDKKLDMETAPVSEQELYDTALILAEELNTLSPSIRYDPDGFSMMPYSLSTMGDKLMDTYSSLTEAYPFIQDLDSNIKPVLASVAMSYTHITGMYTFFTGEANLNVDFPNYTLPFTAAHEFAHQRGIARENEANFVAFLVCISSDDPYIRYCGYLNMYEYVSSALYSSDTTEGKSLYTDVRSNLPPLVRGEMASYSNFYKKYQDSAAGTISNTINNAFLQANGNAEGTRSYGLVVDLAVAYYKEK